jgi:hypothetical protein
MADIAGTWQGDKGINTVRILADGRGTAGFPGALMKLQVQIVGNSVIVRQDQPNAPEFYLSTGIGYSLARLIAKDARAMRWVFMLSDDGLKLAGVKESTAVEIKNNKIQKLDNSWSREASWTRIK